MKYPRTPEWAVARVHPSDLEAKWPTIEAGLRRTFSRVKTDLTFDLLRRAGAAGKVSFWVIVDDDWTVCGSISVAHFPNGTGDILTLSGDRGLAWMPSLFNRWVDALRGLGVNELTLTGRRGFARVLKPLGFVVTEDDGDNLIVMNRAL